LNRPLKITLIAAASLAALLSCGLLAGAWYVSGILKHDGLIVRDGPPVYDLAVVAVDTDSIRLRTSELTGDAIRWKTAGESGFRERMTTAGFGTILELTDSEVEREFEQVHGTFEPGDRVRIDRFTYDNDPLTALGLGYQDVEYASPFGSFPVWYFPGSRDTWVVFVHGRTANREEAYRMLPTVLDMGFPALVISYRNDPDGIATEKRLYEFGQTEWEELEGAVKYATDNGAEDVVLVGFSMGGAIVTNFMYQSDRTKDVRALVMDSPMLNFNATVDKGAEDRGLPGPFAWLAKYVAQVRFGVHWGKLDYLRDVDRLEAPILLFHGDADETVPKSTSDALAAARPDIVTYIETPGATHVGSWNVDRARYEAAVREFLSKP